MGPTERKDQSSESDEDSSVRHDKFKSERFQVNRPTVESSRESSRYNNKYSGKNYRDRSPTRNRDVVSSTRNRDVVSSTSFRNETKSRHERDSSRRHHSKSSRSVDSKTSVYSKKSEKIQEPKTSKNNLSSLLKNFDKKVESKRNNQSNLLEIGPALPPHLKKTQVDTESISNSTTDISPALSTQLKNIQESSNSGQNEIDVPLKSDTESLLDLDTETSSDSDKGTTLEEKNTFKSNLENTLDRIDNSAKVDDVESSEQDLFGPTLPPKSEPETYGPVLPPKLEPDSYGPALPPRRERDTIQGPALPPELEGKLGEIAQEDSEDDDMVGPQVEGKISKAQYLLDLRAMHIKRKLDEEKGGTSAEVKRREEWMLELPPGKAANLGLGPRSFRMKGAPDMSNRSSWTDTPADRLRKEQEALRGETESVSSEEVTRMAFIKERDNVMDEMLVKTKKEDQSHSLLELHQKKLKKKKKKEEKEGKKKERRPFDRNIDLQVNRFDEAQKKAIFKKAQLLNSRFSSGESKYL